MITNDYPLNCWRCGKKVGVLFLGYIGVPHHTDPQICCIECLPARLDEVDKEGSVDKEKIQGIRNWLGA